MAEFKCVTETGKENIGKALCVAAYNKFSKVILLMTLHFFITSIIGMNVDTIEITTKCKEKTERIAG